MQLNTSPAEQSVGSSPIGSDATAYRSDVPSAGSFSDLSTPIEPSTTTSPSDANPSELVSTVSHEVGSTGESSQPAADVEPADNGHDGDDLPGARPHSSSSSHQSEQNRSSLPYRPASTLRPAPTPAANRMQKPANDDEDTSDQSSSSSSMPAPNASSERPSGAAVPTVPGHSSQSTTSSRPVGNASAMTGQVDGASLSAPVDVTSRDVEHAGQSSSSLPMPLVLGSSPAPLTFGSRSPPSRPPGARSLPMDFGPSSSSHNAAPSRPVRKASTMTGQVDGASQSVPSNVITTYNPPYSQTSSSLWIAPLTRPPVVPFGAGPPPFMPPFPASWPPTYGSWSSLPLITPANFQLRLPGPPRSTTTAVSRTTASSSNSGPSGSVRVAPRPAGAGTATSSNAGRSHRPIGAPSTSNTTSAYNTASSGSVRIAPRPTGAATATSFNAGSSYRPGNVLAPISEDRAITLPASLATIPSPVEPRIRVPASNPLPRGPTSVLPGPGSSAANPIHLDAPTTTNSQPALPQPTPSMPPSRRRSRADQDDIDTLDQTPTKKRRDT